MRTGLLFSCNLITTLVNRVKLTIILSKPQIHETGSINFLCVYIHDYIQVLNHNPGLVRMIIYSQYMLTNIAT